MRKSILPIILTSAALFFTTGALSFAQTAPLKSAQELASFLREKLNTEYEVQKDVGRPVIAAEQGDTKVVIYKPGADWNTPDGVVWEWDPFKSLDAGHAEWFRNVSDCKPVRGDSLVLVCASAGGAAVVRYSDKKVLFLAKPGGNTHSITMLPDGNIATVSSTGAYLALFAAPEYDAVGDAPETSHVVKRIPLKGGHGVVWDEKRQILWALGDNEIIGFEYVGTKEKPDLKEICRIKTEGDALGGHDFYPAPGYDALMTTGRGVTVFDPETRKILPVSGYRDVKSISLSPEGEIIVQVPAEMWWNESILYGNKQRDKIGTNTGAKFYKARWFVPNEFSDPAGDAKER